MAEVFRRIEGDGLTEYHAYHLVTNYGKQTESILKEYHSLKEKDPEVRLALAELDFGIAYECILTPEDFFTRRTGRLYFDIQSVKRLMQPVLERFREHFNAEEAQINEWQEALDKEIAQHSEFKV